jgi:murein DD-endopeptidase MepM/ murein hydrolase activator NlpD
MMLREKIVLQANRRVVFSFLALAAVVLLAACSQASAAMPEMEAASQPALPTPTPLLRVQATTATTPLSNPPPKSPTAPPAKLHPAASPTAARVIFPTPCPDWCSIAYDFPFHRPLPESAQLAVDPSYRFGSTQNGARDPHHGVEFLNPTGTPVLAASEGEVVFAGNDTQERFSPYFNFYGNLVVLQHSLPGLQQPVFTLYAHLSEIAVRAGDRVQTGDAIGKVGMSGSATGSHLHFEVRLGENTYAASRNPELWLMPLEGQDGTRYAAAAGRVLYPAGYRSELSSIVLERLTGPQGDAISQIYLTPYEEAAITGQPPWEETFAAGDLPAGWYRITFIQFGLQSREVQLFPGQLTLLTFDLRSAQ